MERMSSNQAVAGQVAEILCLLETGNITDAAHELEELTGSANEQEHEDHDGDHTH